MSKQNKVNELAILGEKNTILQKLIKFLKENHSYVEGSRIDYYKNKIGDENAKVKLRKIFIDSLNASGGNNLSSSGIACQNFYNLIEKMPNAKIIDFQNFINIFNENCNSNIADIEDLYIFLANSPFFPNIRNKKAAIFIRNIFWLQETEKKIFNNLVIEPKSLKIPVDIIIVTILNKVLKLTDQNILKADRDFNLINEFSYNIMGEDYMVIEDLWFWGFFNTKSIKLNETDRRERIIEFNSEKYYSADFIYPNKELENKLNEFNSIIINK